MVYNVILDRYRGTPENAAENLKLSPGPQWLQSDSMGSWLE